MGITGNIAKEHGPLAKEEPVLRIGAKDQSEEVIGEQAVEEPLRADDAMAEVVDDTPAHVVRESEVNQFEFDVAFGRDGGRVWHGILWEVT